MNATKLACGWMLGLSLAAAACSAPSEDPAQGQSEANATEADPARDIQATDDERLWMLSGLWARTPVTTSNGLDLAVFTVGGADADINSNAAWLTVGRGTKTTAFELGMMIQTVEKAEMTSPDVLHLTGTNVTINNKGAVVPEKWEATVKLGEGTVTLTRNGEATSIAAATDEGARFLPQVRAIRSVDDREMDAFIRVFETAVPGATAHRLMVSITALPEEKTFDLGIDLEMVMSVSSPKDGVLTIAGLDAKTFAPVVYTLAYSVDEENGISSSAKLTRGR